MRIFLSYRRDDSSAHAGRLHDALVQEFGPRSVFQDVVAIGAGEDFTRAIDNALDDCDATLVVIGPTWLAPVDGGLSRLHEPDDYVRIEVAEALARELKVVPVLVGGAVMPAETDLPDHLRPLTKRQAVMLRDDTWHNDVGALVRSLRGEPQIAARATPRSRRPWLAAGIAAVAVVVAVVAGVLFFGGDGDEGSADAEPTPCTLEVGTWTRVVDVDTTAVGVVPVSTGGTLEFRVTDVQFRTLSDGATWEVVLDTVMTSRASGDPESHGYWHYDQLVVDGFVSENLSCAFVETEVVEENQQSRARIGFEVNDDPAGSLTLIVEESESRDTIVLTP